MTTAYTAALLAGLLLFTACADNAGVTLTDDEAEAESSRTTLTTTSTTTAPTTTSTTTTTTTAPTTTSTTTTTTTTIPLPTINRFLFDKARVAVDESARLSWIVSNSVFVELKVEGEEYQQVEPSGHLIIAPQEAGTYSYELRATGASGKRLSSYTSASWYVPYGMWVTRNWTDPVTEVHTKGIGLNASDSTGLDWTAEDEVQSLHFQCRGSDRVALVVYGGYIAENVRTDRIKVEYNVDGKIYSRRDRETTDNESVWVSEPQTFFNSLLDSETLVYRSFNYDGDTNGTLFFDVSHLRNNLERVPCFK